MAKNITNAQLQDKLKSVNATISRCNKEVMIEKEFGWNTVTLMNKDSQEIKSKIERLPNKEAWKALKITEKNCRKKKQSSEKQAFELLKGIE